MNTRALRARRFERILLLKPSAVGDVIHTVPVLVKLRARYPDARIDWLLTPPIAELIRHHPALSNAVLFDRRRYARAWRDRGAAADLARLLADLRRTRYDLVLDLHGQFRSALLALATGAPVRVGFDRPRRRALAGPPRRLVEEAYRHGWTGTREGAWLAYTHRIPVPTLDVHAADRYLWAGRLLGFDGGPPDFRLPVPPQAEARVGALLGRLGVSGRPLAVLVPGTIWPTKHWHVAGFAAVARHLAQTGRAVVLAGSAAERERCRAVQVLCPGAADLSGQTALSDLAALVRRAAVCVTNDSGSMHLAVALGRPVVSVFGPTDPVWIGPYGRPHAVVRADVPCAPCYLRRLRSCPYGHACMNEVTAEQVIERLGQILADEGLPAAG
jgi:lipopolysaccharide heptosyltransferase I